MNIENNFRLSDLDIVTISLALKNRASLIRRVWSNETMPDVYKSELERIENLTKKLKDI